MVKISDPNSKVAGDLQRWGIKKVTLDDLENDDLQFRNLLFIHFQVNHVSFLAGVSTEKRVSLNLKGLIIPCQPQNKVSTILQLLQMGVISLKTKH